MILHYLVLLYISRSMYIQSLFFLGGIAIKRRNERHHHHTTEEEGRQNHQTKEEANNHQPKGAWRTLAPKPSGWRRDSSTTLMLSGNKEGEKRHLPRKQG